MTVPPGGPPGQGGGWGPSPQGQANWAQPPQAGPQQPNGDVPHAQGHGGWGPSPPQPYGQQPYGAAPQPWGQATPQQPNAQQPWGAPGQIYGAQQGSQYYAPWGAGPVPGPADPTLREAVVTGRGYASPRKKGVTYLLIGIACVVGVFAVAVASNRVFIYPAVVGPIVFMPGMFMVATGEPLARAAAPVPSWARVGFVGAVLFGGLLGLATMFLYFA